MEHANLILFLASIFGLLLAWGVGANDVANAMGTSVGSKALTLKQAVIVAAIFEVSGAMLVGGEVTDTIRSQLINTDAFTASPDIVITGMLASLLASGMWLIIASMYGWPVSTTHSIIGAIIGFTVIELGWSAVQWGQVTNILLSWIVTPMIAGFFAYGMFRNIQDQILNTDDPVLAAKRYVPRYIFIAMFIIALVTLIKGLTHLGWHFHPLTNVLIAFCLSAAAALIGMLILRYLHLKPRRNVKSDFINVENIFSVLMIFTACAMAFAHGSNDVANAIGPVATIVSIVQHGGDMSAAGTVPIWILLLGAVGILLGLVMYGYRVIATIGNEITELTPSRGFAATLATASTVVVASGTGLPISTTQTLVGAILGVGLARGIGALRLEVVRNILMSWAITLPAGAVFTIVIFYILRIFLT